MIIWQLFLPFCVGQLLHLLFLVKINSMFVLLHFKFQISTWNCREQEIYCTWFIKVDIFNFTFSVFESDSYQQMNTKVHTTREYFRR